MAIYFFDSSALVKRYAQETGSVWVETVTSRHYVFLARITQVEVIAAVERRKRIGTLSAAQASSAITAFRAHFSTEYALIDVSRSLIGQAADLAEIHGLRAYDAVQLQNERNA
ncbi:MAG: type II toxin-antitoxin system VapC family toxin, partial [Blastocatellia bacterium]